jgi:hypothetical protein
MMADLCTLDADGRIEKRFDNTEDIYAEIEVNGETKIARFSQAHVASMTPTERAEINAAWVAGPEAVAYDPETQKLELVKAGVGDLPVDTYNVVPMTDEQHDNRVKAKLLDLDAQVIRVVEEVVDAVLSDPGMAGKISQAAKDTIAARRALRAKLRG